MQSRPRRLPRSVEVLHGRSTLQVRLDAPAGVVRRGGCRDHVRAYVQSSGGQVRGDGREPEKIGEKRSEGTSARVSVINEGGSFYRHFTPVNPFPLLTFP